MAPSYFYVAQTPQPGDMGSGDLGGVATVEGGRENGTLVRTDNITNATVLRKFFGRVQFSDTA